VVIETDRDEVARIVVAPVAIDVVHLDRWEAAPTAPSVSLKDLRAQLLPGGGA
jgi:hypothetical protein